MVMGSFLTTRRRVTALLCILAGLIAVVVVPFVVTQVQRATTHVAVTEFRTTVQPVLNLEGSADGMSWAESATLGFGAGQMELKVGEANAVYSPLWVRPGAGTNAPSSAIVSETGLPDTAFATALRGEIYLSPPACNANGINGAQPIASGALRGQTSSPFDLGQPTSIGQTGEPVGLCVRVWMNDNNWLLAGTSPGTAQATWSVTATTTLP
ncbi:Tat pathway signal sequence domain protein [Corynebacterium efficiens YS-314]|nr:hypothetical protein [Corynebacterium efficiens]EEW51159.1 Tat pathway signal sequence domain protein [Corynebacterium efficiens YS-314]